MNRCVNCDNEIGPYNYRCFTCADLVARGTMAALYKRSQLRADEAESMVEVKVEDDGRVSVRHWQSYHEGYRQALIDVGVAVV